ncbi:efflux RND transporter permease subunit [Legionella sainthelensi]|uniref:efflux RND transporter permease subunit n=1 Tax=Legionella sainthelensi TaxID=28087 RepID=UPI0018D5945D|nr:efflux RND transporter permease subunit [Legionella sainthelensi]
MRKFNADRPPLIIIAVIPFAMIDITLGLLLTGAPFGFIALLGTMSLFGMMIKNSVVLLDQVNLNIARGMKPYDAVISAGLNRLAPVVNAIIARCFLGFSGGDYSVWINCWDYCCYVFSTSTFLHFVSH